LVITIGCCLLAVFLVVVLYREGPTQPHEPIRLAGVWRSFDTRLRRLLAADILARWAEGIPRVFVVIYCTQQLGLSAVLFGWLMTVQRATNLVAYLPAIGLGDRPNRKPFVLATFAFFALFPLVLVNVTGFWGAVIAFVIAGLWEVGEPARKALIVDLAPEAVRGRAVGLYYLLRNLAVVPAAILGGLLWRAAGSEAMFHAAFAAGVAGFAFYAACGPGDGSPSLGLKSPVASDAVKPPAVRETP
ncbi:MAG TPA: MFS transporter, partial [Gemmataceae bacterium]|nr:MFS transporter [Gemmataceae bacterium]